MATATAVKPSLTIKRRLNASPAKVFAAWTKPEELMKWMGPAQIDSVKAETDLRIGGSYHIQMRTAGGDEHNVSGDYREIVPNERLVFTWAWRSTPERVSLVTVQLKPDGDGTLMTFLHEQFFDEDARDRHNQGWTGAFDKLEKYLN
jgi:uncharacterized protein YndB with AHSA1/START domain